MVVSIALILLSTDPKRSKILIALGAVPKVSSINCTLPLTVSYSVLCLLSTASIAIFKVD
jgi:hypothetical protein